MPSNDGSQEPLPKFHRKLTVSLEELKDLITRQETQVVLNTGELDARADGEPYCFRCGRPASSFVEYRDLAEAEGLTNAWQYVIQEEGTYNPLTNRFACDECYIAIGMPSETQGWIAP